MTSTTTRGRALAIAGLLAFLAPSSALAQLNKDQEACLNALNKDAAKLAAVRGKVSGACLKAAGKGKLPTGQSADQCLVADAKGLIAKATSKLDADFTAKCGTLPSFGVPGGTTAGIIAGAAVDQSLNLLADVFGDSLTTGAIDCAGDKTGCGCQQAVDKGYEKIAAASFKQFVKCKKATLKDGATAASALEDCVDNTGTAGSIAADGKQKIAKAIAKLTDAVGKKCGGVSTAETLPGLCAGTSAAMLPTCVAQRVACRICLTINGTDNLAVDCDSFDDGQLNLSCPYETFNLRSLAQPAHSPGSPGVTVSDANLITQFGSADISLNNARFTRFRLSPIATQPDAILVLVPGFEGGANDFKIFAENLIPKVFLETGKVLEVWAYDRRSNQLEDTVGLDIAEAHQDPFIALDWLFGTELSLPLDATLVAGPNRRAVFYDAHVDTAFIANWTPLVFSQDIDAIVEKARTVAKNANVFLGGHSAGTGFTARYASTDFNLTGMGPAQPGYAKLRGLVLLEGGGGSTGGAPLTADTLDRIEAAFDGGLYGAVRDNAGRCVDGTTACTQANEATTCIGQMPPKCTLPTNAYSLVPGVLNPRIFAQAEIGAIQSITDLNTGQVLTEVDQGSPGNNAGAKVPDLAPLAFIGPATVEGGFGTFLDKDGVIASSVAPFVAMSVGEVGPTSCTDRSLRRRALVRRRRRCPEGIGEPTRRSRGSIASSARSTRGTPTSAIGIIPAAGSR
jgi:pimeloyl-ACP methyl ester carboxylesterase